MISSKGVNGYYKIRIGNLFLDPVFWIFFVGIIIFGSHIFKMILDYEQAETE